jgi:uncharacterized protein (TIGR03083 family)
MDSSVEAIAAALAAEHLVLDDRLASLGDDDWHRQSRCTEWSVADVVLHLAQTDELAVASFEERFMEVVAAQTAGLPVASDMDESVGLIVDRERGAAPANVPMPTIRTSRRKAPRRTLFWSLFARTRSGHARGLRP